MADRFGRVQIFEGTLRLCGENERLRSAVAASIENQKIIWQDAPLAAPVARFESAAEIALVSARTFEAARRYAALGKRVCALNFASCVTPGGGVTWGAGAQEESLCRISTLFPAISDASVGDFYARHWEWIRGGEMGRENRDDCIYTPGILVIREDTFDCALLPESDWYAVDVITCAAPDLRLSETGRAFSPGREELTALFRSRWRRILSVAAEGGAQVLILGAFGCGAFCNPPEVVVQAFNDICAEYAHCFETIAFALFAPDRDSPNYRAFRNIRNIREPGDSNAPAIERPAGPSPSDGGADRSLLWLRLLQETDKLNRMVKEPGWRPEDRQDFYAFKDRMLELLLEKRPSCVALQFYYVPCLRYSNASKDRAAEMMRGDGGQYSLDYYLAQLPTSPEDVEVPERSSVELQAVCLEQTFSYHMPIPLAERCGIAANALPRKPWIAAPDFHHERLVEAKRSLEELLRALA